MILFLVGCVGQLYPGRVWDCDGWERVEVQSPGPLYLRDLGPDDSCRVAAEGKRFPRPDGDVFADADVVEVVGAFRLEGTWNPGTGTTDIQLTDRENEEDTGLTDDEPLLDLVRIQDGALGAGRFEWERTDAGTRLYVECERCSVRVRGVDLVEIRQLGASATAWVCGSGTLDLDSPLEGLVAYHDVTDPSITESVFNHAWRLDDRPDACWR